MPEFFALCALRASRMAIVGRAGRLWEGFNPAEHAAAVLTGARPLSPAERVLTYGMTDGDA